MKQIFLIALLIGAFAATTFAQDKADERGRRVQALRIAVFTEVLNLTPAEAEGFWPIYNGYQDQREALQKQMRPSNQLDGMSDAEVEDYVKKHFELRQRELDLEKDLGQKLRKVLPLRKIAKIPIAERRFREDLVEKLRNNQEKRVQKRQGGR
jgi:pyruvate/2-oxoacid:ferredoxin oxidoreductase beta subunit